MARVIIGGLMVLTSMVLKFLGRRLGSPIEDDFALDIGTRMAITIGYVLIFWTICERLFSERSDHVEHHED